MSKAILPDGLTEKIENLIEKGMSSIETYDLLIDDAAFHMDLEDQLIKSITSIRGKGAYQNNIGKKSPDRKINIPERKKFNINEHEDTAGQLNRVITEKQFQNISEPIAFDILENHEGFKQVESVNDASGFHNPPFDFLAFRGKTPYLIKFKMALNSFNPPDEIEKRRLKELRESVDELKVAIIQVRINTGEYRMFSNNDINLFFDGRKVSILPVVGWIESRINNF